MERLVRVRQILLSVGLILVLALSGGPVALAATPQTLTISGVTEQGTRLESIPLLSYKQSVQTAREAGSGIATGRRQYQPLLIRKRIDKASPLLMRAMDRGEIFRTLTLSINEGGGGGRPATLMTITLTNAQIVAITHGGDCDDDCDGTAEDVSFIATKIAWSADGVTWEDDWTTTETETNDAATYFMAINEKGVPTKPKKQTKTTAYRTQIISPRDAGSGLPTGRRQHSPFLLVVPSSSETPELTEAFLTGRHLQRVSVITYGPDGVAKGAVSLVDVTVVAMTETRRSKLGSVKSNPLYADLLAPTGEDCVYELTYQKIEWLDAAGGVTHEDTWDTQR